MQLLCTRSYPQYNLVVYRGFAVEETKLELYSSGIEFFFPGFGSCSKTREAPENFASMRKNELERSTSKKFSQVILEITPTTKAHLATYPELSHTNIDLERFSDIPGEKEVLYPPLATFVVSQVETDHVARTVRIVAKDSRNQLFDYLFKHVKTPEKPRERGRDGIGHP